LGDLGDVHALLAPRSEPVRIPIGLDAVDRECWSGSVPCDAPILPRTETGGLFQRHPSVLRKATVVLGHLERVAVLECDSKHGPDASLPNVHDVGVGDVPARLLAHPQAHTLESLAHRNTGLVGPLSILGPVSSADVQTWARRSPWNRSLGPNGPRTDVISDVLLSSLDELGQFGNGISSFRVNTLQEQGLLLANRMSRPVPPETVELLDLH